METDLDPSGNDAGETREPADRPASGAGHDRPSGPEWFESISEQFRDELRRNGGRLKGKPGLDGRLLTSIFESLTDGVIVADHAGRFVFFNRAAEEILGLGPISANPGEWPRAYGCYLPDKTTPHPPERLPLARALRGEHVYDAEIYIRNEVRASGAWISVNSSPLIDESGGVYGGVVVFRDITQRRENYAIVRRLHEAVERTADSVFITDTSGRIEYVNAAFEQTTGYGREEALGETPRILKSGLHDKAYYEQLWSTIRAGNVHTGTVINRKKNGELYHAEQTVTPVRDSAGNLTHFVSVVKDVTELKKAKEREVEMRLAHEVQQQLYPAHAPELPGFDLFGAAFPADATCGDYYDFIEMAGDRLGLAIGDVRGHGLGSALLMVETRALLRSLTGVSSDVGNIFRQLNRTLCEDTEDNGFVTLILAEIDPARRELAFVNAGHNPGYVLDAAGAVRESLTATGLPLGLFRDRNFPRSQRIALQEGDLIVLLTDGVIEVQDANEEFFGAERALDVIRAGREGSASEIVHSLHQALQEFSGGVPQPDDVTVVVCKVLGRT
jgi:PAS domain S-box-containing protein